MRRTADVGTSCVLLASRLEWSFDVGRVELSIRTKGLLVHIPYRDYNETWYMAPIFLAHLVFMDGEGLLSPELLIP